MTVVDVNTGKFTGSGGNLEETVTKNNLEAAEEMVRQLRLRDIGGIIVIDFIDMVLESNRDLVLRRLVECLGRDRTRHQVAEVTSLGLVQMTRKRIGTGLLEAFGTDCEACKGRGLVLHDHPVEAGTGPTTTTRVVARPWRERWRWPQPRRPRRQQRRRNGQRQWPGNGGGAARRRSRRRPTSPRSALRRRRRTPRTRRADSRRDPDREPVDRDRHRGPSRANRTEQAVRPGRRQKVIGKATGLVPEPQQVPSEAATPQTATDQAPRPRAESRDRDHDRGRAGRGPSRRSPAPAGVRRDGRPGRPTCTRPRRLASPTSPPVRCRQAGGSLGRARRRSRSSPPRADTHPSPTRGSTRTRPLPGGHGPRTRRRSRAERDTGRRLGRGRPG